MVPLPRCIFVTDLRKDRVHWEPALTLFGDETSPFTLEGISIPNKGGQEISYLAGRRQSFSVSRHRVSSDNVGLKLTLRHSDC